MRIPMVIKNFRFFLLGLGLILAFQSGCSPNLSAIRDFADISADSAEYTNLVEQYVNTPERQKRYQDAKRHGRLEKQKAARVEQQKRLLARHALIEEYMDALSQLADDNLASYDTEFNALGKAVTDNEFAEQKEVEAFTKIGSILTNAVTDRWRKNQLKKIITQANEPFQIVTKSLRDIVVKAFGEDVQIERVALGKYYDTKLAQSTDAAGKAALEEWTQKSLQKGGGNDLWDFFGALKMRLMKW